MSDYSISLKQVYSAPSEEKIDLDTCPYKMGWQQKETVKAIAASSIDVIVNTAMTGDGKTLAALIRSLLTNYYAMVLYPTNELARDQELQIKEYLKQLQPKIPPRIVRLSGEELEIYSQEEGLKKAAAIATLSNQSEILLTNPDIFHYLHNNAYITPKDSPDKLWGRIDKNYDLFIFDEFHIFSAPQIASVINTMLLIRHTNRKKKFLFLSATPNPELIERLQKVGFRVKVIDPIAKNKYQFPDTISQCQELESEGWRQITRGITLNFVALEALGNSESWLRNNGELILNYFLNYPGSKGAIILNSIASVKRLVPFFRELFAKHNLTVGENTGLSGKGEKQKSLSCDLLLATSTIDVGVDFKINLLIFESADAGNFMQRLGRLGRHQLTFTQFTAYALCPVFLIERLFKGESPPLTVNGIGDRQFFQQQITEKYRQINDFRGYYSRWGGVQSVKICYQLGHKTIKSQYEQSRKAFKDDCEQVFNTSLGRIAGRIKQWQKEWQQISGNKNGNPIAEEAWSFRGKGPFLYGVYDETETKEVDRFKTYELPGMLSNLDIQPMTKVDFLRRLEDTANRYQVSIAKGKYEYCLGFMKLNSYREEKLNWRFVYSGDLESILESWQVQVLTRMSVWQPENYWINEINKKMRKQYLVSYILRYPVAEVRRRLRLPIHFGVYPLSQQTDVYSNPPYTIAFGQSAILLDTLSHWWKSQECWM